MNLTSSYFALIRALAGAPTEISSYLEDNFTKPTFEPPRSVDWYRWPYWHLLLTPASPSNSRAPQTGNQVLFNQFADLVMLPELRMVLLPLLHSSPSEELATALVKLQQATKG